MSTTATMTAAERLTRFCAVVARHTAAVERETRTIDQAHALMQKWAESRLIDAISREAKSRAVREMPTI